jgi:hypothetical protein
MVKATGLQRPERGTIGKSAACRDYPMSTYELILDLPGEGREEDTTRDKITG